MRILATVLTLASTLPFARAALAEPAQGAEAPLVQPSGPAAAAPHIGAASSLPPQAEAPSPLTGRSHAKRGAFFMNAQAGVGHAAMTISDGGHDLTVSGPALSFSGAFGATVLPNLVLYGQVGIYQAANPKFEQGGVSADSQNATLTQVWLGPGLTYYFTPINAFIGTSVGVSRTVITMETTRTKYEGRSNLGPALTMQVGKEWWLNERLAFGITAQALFATMQDSEGDATITGRGLSVGLSASYN